jgi:hypothetical protein
MMIDTLPSDLILSIFDFLDVQDVYEQQMHILGSSLFFLISIRPLCRHGSARCALVNSNLHTLSQLSHKRRLGKNDGWAILTILKEPFSWSKVFVSNLQLDRMFLHPQGSFTLLLYKFPQLAQVQYVLIVISNHSRDCFTNEH